MKILYIGDIVARIGRKAVTQVLPELKREKQIDFVIAQSENMATGNGLTEKGVSDMMDAGVDFFTGGNHSFKKPEFLPKFEDHTVPVIRPANMPGEHVPGRGWAVVDTAFGKILIINVLGITFNSEEVENSLRVVDKILEENSHQKLAASLVDFHGDLSSEKVAVGFYLDGRVSAVVGSHTHVPTADARVLSGGTAHITDTGMTGPIDSVLGVKKEIIIGRWLGDRTESFDWPKSGTVRFSSVLIDVDQSGKAKSIEQILRFIDV
ncbi:YmdB family metallophosphoesterase [Candidatus Saccharibacteria bacterium]|nr:YmdB family metallophosphoesterase [Candidatus Saccharibacteria bacterium]